LVGLEEQGQADALPAELVDLLLEEGVIERALDEVAGLRDALDVYGLQVAPPLTLPLSLRLLLLTGP
jgi:hypothetical protein